MTPDDVFELAWASDPRLSPDGSLVAYCVNTVDRSANAYRSTIFLAPVDGSAPPRNLTAGEKADLEPRWSPEGSRLAFVSNRGGQRQLYVVPSTGGEPLRLTDLPENVREPAWSPDGTRIAFAARVPDERYEGDDDRVRPPHRFRRLQYKLDDESWTGDRRLQIHVVAADGSSAPVQITSGDYEHFSPTWSPDGSRVALVSAREGDWDTKLVTDVYVVSADGGEPERITGGDGICEVPAWSSDGSLIAYRYTPGVWDDPHHAQIAVVAPNGGEPRILTAALDRHCNSYPPLRGPAWDGDALVFACEDHGNAPLYRVAAVGGEPELLVEGELEVKGWDVAAGTVVHAATTATSLTELYVGDRRLTWVGEALRRGRELAEPERFTAVSPDGTEVEAWIVRPVGLEEPGRTCPVLLNIHGGPFTQYGNHFFDEFQVYAAAGYAVLYSNPRGSSGYSEEWGRAIREPPGWGSVDYDDLMAVTDEALRRFDFCDPERLGVLGGSYGGYMTSWIIGHTDRFRAAVSERSVNHLVSFHGSSDQGFTFKGYFGSFVWEDLDAYLRMSPLTYAEQMTTPVLILHSEDDLRCPVEQAEQLFTTLRLLGREVEFVRFPHGEGHELSRSGSPRHRAQRFEIILDWFDRHLKA